MNVAAPVLASHTPHSADTKTSAIVANISESTDHDTRVRVGADPDIRPIAGGLEIASIEPSDEGLQVEWSDSATGFFHWVWLRDNCLCADCYHPAAWEKMHDFTLLDLDIKPISTVLEQGELVITWPEMAEAGTPGISRTHESRFNASWLRRFCYEDWARDGQKTQIETWTARIGNNRPTIDHSAIMETDEGLLTWLQYLRRYGFAIVRNAPQQEGVVTETARRIGFLRQTHFGVDYTVMSKPNPENVAYTPVYVAPHTDLSYTQTPPGIQFLHCIDFEATGGDSILVDGFAVAERLKQEDPEAFELLSTVAMDHRFHDHDYDMRRQEPIIQLDLQGEVIGIRTNRQGEGPLCLDPALVKPYMRAKQAFAKLTRHPDMTLNFRVNPGDIMCFHNHRVMHGRLPYDAHSGKRRLQGTYVDCDQAWSRLRVLEANLTPR